MIKIGNLTFQELKNKFQVKSPWDVIIIFIIALLIAIPAFMIVHKNIQLLDWAFYIDRIILFILIFALLFFSLKRLRKLTLLVVFGYAILLLYGTLFGNYGFVKVAEDYNSLLYSMNENPYPQDIIITKLLPFPNKTKVIQAIEFDNPKVRNFALFTTTKYFKNVKGYREYKTIIQSFAIFKEINSRWNYVHDPKGSDYIAKATESLQHFSGDCDDHSILMAACIRAIGGIPRLIHTKGHIYPEIYIGTKSDLEKINFLIKKELFPNEAHKKPIHYHIDERGKIWLNLDYTAKYPGGPFLNEEILSALTLE
jgi:Ca2+/Na+ antiporter